MLDGRRTVLVVALLALGAGCGDGPPFDELPLRDALRAEPEAVAALSPAAREKLAARLEAARTGDLGTDTVTAAEEPAALVTALDEARAQRSVDALVVGMVADGVARPVSSASAEDFPLPVLEGVTATGTATLETKALAGSAGAALRGLLAAARASRLERVIGWPVGAVAIGDTVYVDAAWLVSMAPIDNPADGGATGAAAAASGETSSASPTGGLAPVAVVDTTSSTFDGGRPAEAFDAGTYRPPSTPTPPPTPPPPPAPPTTAPSFWDACAAGCTAGDSCDTSDDDSCDDSDDGSDDSCSGSTDDGSSDDCSAPPDDGSSCRVAPGRERSRPSTLVWVMAPLGFLVGRRR